MLGFLTALGSLPNRNITRPTGPSYLPPCSIATKPSNTWRSMSMVAMIGTMQPWSLNKMPATPQELLLVLPGHDSLHVIELWNGWPAWPNRCWMVWTDCDARVLHSRTYFLCLTGLGPPRLGCLPWFVTPNRLLWQRLARTLFEEDVLQPAVWRLAAVADALSWPVLAHLCRELGVVLDALDFEVLQWWLDGIGIGM